MAADVAELVLRIRGEDQASQVLKGVGKEADGLGSKLGTALKVGAIAGAAAIAGIGVASVAMAAKFDQSMREVNTLINLPAEGFSRLKQDVLDLSKEMGVATTQAVPALYQAISAGVPVDNAIDFMRIASKTAIGGVTDLETAVDGLTTAMNAFQIPVSEAESVSDAMFVAMKAGKTTVGELSASLFNVAPIANAAGLGLEEVLAGVSALTTAGVPTSVAATQVRAAIQGMIKPSADVTKVFKTAGFESGQLAIEQLGLAGAMQIMADAAEGDIGALTKLVGSVEGTGAILSLTGAQAGTFTDIMEQMANRSGATSEAFEEMNRGASRQWAILKNQLNVAMIELGSMLLPLVTAAMVKLAPAITSVVQVSIELIRGFIEIMRGAGGMGESFSDANDRLRPLREVVAAVGLTLRDTLIPAFVSGAQTLRSIFGPAVETVFNFIVNNRAAMIAAIVAIGAAIALSLGPVSLAFLAITGIITLVGLVRDNWDALKAKAEEIFGSLPGIVQTAMTFVYENIRSRAEGVIQVVRNMVEAFINIFQFWKAVFTGDWNRAWEEFKEILNNYLNIMLGAFRAAWGNIPEIILGLAGDAARAAGEFGSAIYDAIRVQIEAMVRWVTGQIDALVGKVEAVVNKVKGIIGGSANDLLRAEMARQGVPASQIDQVVPRQHGGPVRHGQPYIVGEAGPELFIPRMAGAIVPNHALGGASVVVHIHGDNYGLDDLQRKVAAAWMEAYRGGAFYGAQLS